MIDISTLKTGDIVRNLGSGCVRTVTADAQQRHSIAAGTYWRAMLSGDVECSNAIEWELLARGPFFPIERITEGYAVTMNGVRCEASSIDGLTQLLLRLNQARIIA